MLVESTLISSPSHVLCVLCAKAVIEWSRLDSASSVDVKNALPRRWVYLGILSLKLALPLIIAIVRNGSILQSIPSWCLHSFYSFSTRQVYLTGFTVGTQASFDSMQREHMGVLRAAQREVSNPTCSADMML